MAQYVFESHGFNRGSKSISKYSNQVKYTPERCLFIYNPNPDVLKIHVEFDCYTEEDYAQYMAASYALYTNIINNGTTGI